MYLCVRAYDIYLAVVEIQPFRFCIFFCRLLARGPLIAGRFTWPFTGFPYADCFVVHVRHVASRVGNRDLSIKIGMHVEFLKSCMFESKIRVSAVSALLLAARFIPAEVRLTHCDVRGP